VEVRALPKEKKIAENKETTAVASADAAPPVKATLSKKPAKKAKLPPKNKSRLPRKEKKAAQKAAARA
jgi:hypothetical protein